jgi:hypothetical protein
MIQAPGANPKNILGVNLHTLFGKLYKFLSMHYFLQYTKMTGWVNLLQIFL